MQPGLNLSSLGQGGEIPQSQLVQLLNTQETISEVPSLKVPLEIPTSKASPTLVQDSEPPVPDVSVSKVYE